MTVSEATVGVRLGFMPPSLAIADVDHPGLLRAGDRASAPYRNDNVDFHVCPATDGVSEPAGSTDLLEVGFDVADLSGLDDLQAALARTRAAGRVDEQDAATIRAVLEGATLPLASGLRVKVLYLAGEGFIMRTGGPSGLAVVPDSSDGMNDHGVATSVHADQDVYGTPMVQLMDGRAPSLFRHDSPDGHNHEARLLLVNLWIPLHQVTQPLVLADGRTVDRRRHQLRYGLATGSFLDRDDDLAINDIWTFLHDPDQRWYLRSEMDHRHAYVFNTLSTPHGAGTLPGEDVAERCYRALDDAERAVARGDVAALRDALATAEPVEEAPATPLALRRAIDAMVAVIDEARRDPTSTCGDGATAWSQAARTARMGVVRMSLELRVVVSVDEQR